MQATELSLGPMHSTQHPSDNWTVRCEWVARRGLLMLLMTSNFTAMSRRRQLVEICCVSFVEMRHWCWLQNVQLWWIDRLAQLQLLGAAVPVCSADGPWIGLSPSSSASLGDWDIISNAQSTQLGENRLTYERLESSKLISNKLSCWWLKKRKTWWTTLFHSRSLGKRAADWPQMQVAEGRRRKICCFCWAVQLQFHAKVAGKFLQLLWQLRGTAS